MREYLYPKEVERWGVFEFRTVGKTDGNPFEDYEITASFCFASESAESNTEHGKEVTVSGFYNGDGEYVVRFMPEQEGSYDFTVSGSFSEKVYTGRFTATPPSEHNHGPLRVFRQRHFCYADGTPYYPFGTTCYAWVHQTQALQRKTLDTLKNSAFNKLRFCVFPKHYDYNYENPLTFPYEGTPCDTTELNRETMMRFTEEKSGNTWDFKRFRPEHFERLERRIAELCEMGIEADLILFHPYDRWGFDGMGADNDDFYVRYVVARLAAYRNVWWSLANEYDYIKTKKREDWERIGSLIYRIDPYRRLCSVHNGPHFFDFTREWVTHCSCQGTDRYKATELTKELRDKYKKPVIWDEVLYEGNIELGWGNIGPEEMTRRFWEGTMRGGYVGHGETYLFATDDSIDHATLWWSHGGELHGESPKRIRFLSKLMQELPAGTGLEAMPQYWDAVAATTDREEKGVIFFYFSFLRPLYRDIYIDDETEYEVDVIDTWNMTIVPQGVFKGKFRVVVGGKPYMAVRMRRCNK